MRSYQILWKDSSVFSPSFERIQSATQAGHRPVDPSVFCPGTLAAARPAACWRFAAENSKHFLSDRLLSTFWDTSQFSNFLLTVTPSGALPYLCSPFPFSRTLIMPWHYSYFFIISHKVKSAREKDSWYRILHSCTWQTSVSMCWIMWKSNNVHKNIGFWLEGFWLKFISSMLTTYKWSFKFKM